MQEGLNAGFHFFLTDLFIALGLNVSAPSSVAEESFFWTGERSFRARGNRFTEKCQTLKARSWNRLT